MIRVKVNYCLSVSLTVCMQSYMDGDELIALDQFGMCNEFSFFSYLKSENHLEECVLGSLPVVKFEIDTTLVEKTKHPQGRQHWKVVANDFKVIVRDSPHSTANEIGTLGLNDKVVELQLADDWLQHPLGWSRVNLGSIPILAREPLEPYKGNRCDMTLIVTNYHLYLGDPIQIVDGRNLIPFNSFTAIPLRDILMINTPYTSQADYAFRSDTFTIHSRHPTQGHLWLECASGLRSHVVEMITGAYTRLVGIDRDELKDTIYFATLA